MESQDENKTELIYRVLFNAFNIREIPHIETSTVDDTITRPKSSQVDSILNNFSFF